MARVGHVSTLRLSVLHALRLQGIADAESVAAHVGCTPEAVTAELEALESADLVHLRRGRIPGFALTPEGQVHEARLLVDELEEAGCRPAIEAAYQQFLGFNDQLLGVCTAWQLREIDGETQVNDHRDADYDRSVHVQLEALHAKVVPVLEQLAANLTRFDGHRTRLQTALDRVLAGDHDWFTKPMFPSYHSIWFQLHEDLLATLGTERGAEPNAAPSVEGSTHP